jgi:hypothetical protein
VVHCRIPQKYLGRIHESGTEVRPHVENGRVMSSAKADEAVAEEVA